MFESMPSWEAIVNWAHLTREIAGQTRLPVVKSFGQPSTLFRRERHESGLQLFRNRGVAVFAINQQKNENNTTL